MAPSTLIVCRIDARQILSVTIRYDVVSCFLRSIKMKPQPNRRTGAVPAAAAVAGGALDRVTVCLLYTSPSPRDRQKSRMPSSA